MKPIIFRLALALAAIYSVVAAGSAASNPSDGSDAYWNDKHWHRILLGAVQAVIRYPADAAGQPVRPVPEMARATVRFVYANGKISDPKIIRSSGRPDLDSAFLSQVITAQPPKASGSHATESHTFTSILDMRTPMQDFETAICMAIRAKWEYPRDMILAGELGPTTIDFTYSDGKASDIRIVNSSGGRVMDKSFARSMTEAQLPPPPAWLSTQPLHMEATLDYQLGETSDLCSSSKIRLRTK
jgi:outer membrane biosynthesis protein TonB